MKKTGAARWLNIVSMLLAAIAVAACASGTGDKMADGDRAHRGVRKVGQRSVQLGPRPYYLVQGMAESPLKKRLAQCTEGPFQRTDFSIGHRGAPLQFPEHTRESYEAAVRMGAGILECDVTFTSDRELVCRHSQCDLHTTTDILLTPLAGKCTEPFTPAEFDPVTGERIKAASAKCCTSDITLEEFKSLCGKMDASNPDATTVEVYVGGTADWRTDFYATCGMVVSHAESIALFRQLGVKMTPELKRPSVSMPYDGDYTREAYAQQMIDEYEAAGVPPQDVFAQSFHLDDIAYWLENAPRFGRQAVYLDGRYANPAFDHTDPETWSPSMEALAEQGVRIIAPPIWMLLELDANGRPASSIYAEKARKAGLDIIAWTLERSGPLEDGGGWYYQTVTDAVDNDGDVYEVLDVLAGEVGVIGVFSDWPATVSFYSNCMGLK